MLILALSACGQSVAPSAIGGAAKSSSYQRVTVPGGELEYRTHGRGEPTLLIHGSLLADVFASMLNDPTLRDYRLVTYNRRGFAGSSRAPRPFTIEQQAADAIAVLDRVGADRVHLVGHSYGGAIALEMARRYPHRVASLALLEAAVPAIAEPDPQWVEVLTSAISLYQQGDARGAVIKFGNAVSPGFWDAMTAAGMTHMQEQAMADAATFFEVELPALQQWQFGADDLRRVNIPALVVYGAESRPSSRAGDMALARMLPQAKPKEIFGAGHELQMKQPHAVAEALSTFLRTHRIK
jgi:3-oxoadipate enol-lactonase